ncbi:hypothetical protein WCE01_05985 [Acinetobacter indicus]|uniref:hypothetical protein n=1 Tax=Acinetobacter indicus TaxID=756892 RepID=UPI0034D63A6F
MPDRIQLTRNCRFYLPKVKLTKKYINELFNEASKNKKNSRFILKEVKKNSQNGIDYNYSVIVFNTERPVYFFNDSSLKDEIHAYFLLLEVDGYIAIFKKSCSPVDDLINDKMSLISFETLVNTFDDSSEFQKLATRSMTVSSKAIRSRSYEAENLNGAMSLHTAGRSIPYFVKVQNKGVIQSINLSSGRINEFSQREKINDLVLWVKAQIHNFSMAKSSNFLSNFAKAVDFSEIKDKSPISFMIEFSDLDKIFLDDSIIIYKILKNGSKHALSTKDKNFFAEIISKVYEVDDDLYLNSNCDELLKVNNKSITLDSGFLKKFLVVDSNGVEQSFQQILTKKKAFSICFDDYTYMYSRGRGYQDTSGINQIDSLLELFKVKTELSSATTEKGNLVSTSTDFEATSIFKIVEDIHSSADYILCDDLGIEWADHLVFDESDKSVTFIHSKHKKVANSASDLHEVVGQAIKNLGYMWFTNTLFEAKQEKFGRTYNGSNVRSSVPRCRTGDINNLVPFVINLQKDPHLIRKCVICCTFLSKSQLEVEFQKIKDGEKVGAQIPQIFWIISSFVHASKEMNIVPEVYCVA